MITVKAENVAEIYKDYAEGTSVKNAIYVEFDDINNVDTLLIMRMVGKEEPDVGEIANIAEIMLDGHMITFRTGEKDEDVVARYSYKKGNGNNRLHLMMADKPYLYDILQKTVYALTLKKLTPHLNGSN